VLRSASAPADDPVRLSTANPTRELGSSELTAERRPLTVMFCDLGGSTALSSILPPADRRLLRVPGPWRCRIEGSPRGGGCMAGSV
jgi:hypothetical protein